MSDVDVLSSIMLNFLLSVVSPWLIKSGQGRLLTHTIAGVCWKEVKTTIQD